MKKLIAILLTVLMLAVLLAACGEDASTLPTEDDGKYVLPTDDAGRALMPTDSTGNAVMPTDAKGEPILSTDASGYVIGDIYGHNYYPEIRVYDDDVVEKATEAGASGSGTSKDGSTGKSGNSGTGSGGNSSGSNNATSATDEPVEEEIPVIIATLPDDADEYELPPI